MTAKQTNGPDSNQTPAPAEQGQHSRRDFFMGAAALGGLALAPGVTLHLLGGDAVARPLDHTASPQKRWGMLIDAGRCDDGCDACVSACATENGWDKDATSPTDPQWIRKVELRDPKSGAQRSLPMMCQHCASPPCVDVCPTGASFKRADGIVLVDKHTCIGCRYCVLACPYDARSFIHEPLSDQKPHAPRGKGTVESCTMCVHRVDAGKDPACVTACADSGGGAMLFGDLNDPESEISKRITAYATSRVRDDLNLDTALYYRNI